MMKAIQPDAVDCDRGTMFGKCGMDEGDEAHRHDWLGEQADSHRPDAYHPQPAAGR